MRRPRKASRKTPDELRAIADTTSLDGEELVRASRLTAKIDNNAIGDGFQIYLHTFVLSAKGNWAVVQQGMNDQQVWHGATIGTRLRFAISLASRTPASWAKAKA